MKTTLRIFACITLLTAMQVAAADTKTKPPTSIGSVVVAKLKVLGVLSAKDGDALFRAYLVKWNNQVVVVSDTLAATDYHKGDIVGVLVMKHPFPKGKAKHGLLSFEISD
jgi:hypothetical protein